MIEHSFGKFPELVDKIQIALHDSLTRQFKDSGPVDGNAACSRGDKNVINVVSLLAWNTIKA